jgi:hypothetical protein
VAHERTSLCLICTRRLPRVPQLQREPPKAVKCLGLGNRTS